MDYNRGLVSIAEDTIRTPLQSLGKRQDFAMCIEPTYIPAHTEAIVAVSCPQYHNDHLVILETLLSFLLYYSRRHDHLINAWKVIQFAAYLTLTLSP